MTRRVLLDPDVAREIANVLDRHADELTTQNYFETDVADSFRFEELASIIRPASDGGRAAVVDYPVEALVTLEQLREALRGRDDTVVESVRKWFESPEGYGAAVRSGQFRRIVVALGQACGVEEKGAPPDYRNVFSVEGHSAFPIDLLRTFECVPATSQDATLMMNTMERRFARPLRLQEPCRIALRRISRVLIVPQAFELHGWRIVSSFIEGFEPPNS